MSALPPKAGMCGAIADVRFGPILLQKSAMTGCGGSREVLALAACYPLPSKGWPGSSAAELCPPKLTENLSARSRNPSKSVVAFPTSRVVAARGTTGPHLSDDAVMSAVTPTADKRGCGRDAR
jgi:hypothetical protein